MEDVGRGSAGLCLAREVRGGVEERVGCGWIVWSGMDDVGEKW